MTKLDTSRVTTGLSGDGVWIDDPEAPYRLTAVIEIIDGLPWLTSLTLHPKPGHRHVAYRNWLTGIPLHEVVKLATSVAMGDDYLNETLYRHIATGVPHPRKIATIAEWANHVAWPGGPAGAITSMWGVSRSTAYRWLREPRN